MREFIYHFFAEDINGAMVDGIIVLESKILSANQYRPLKAKIAEKFNLDHEFNIKSLTLIAKI